nr:immunoglobulin light chain junction region [Macaca mulatta]
CHKYISVPLTF